MSSHSRTVTRDSLAKQRQRRSRRKRIVIGVSVGISALLVASLVALGAWWVYINDQLTRDSDGNHVNLDTIEAVTADRSSRPEDPFYMLLMGTDKHYEGEIQRSDTMILARIDPAHKKAALISIPRDTRYYMEGYGWQKINAAYAFGEMEEGHTGAEYTIKAVSDFAGVPITYYAELNFDGFKGVVDALGGVEVDVPVDIIGDEDAGGLDIYKGLQVLDGEHALVFCRARQSLINGDYQRQADQRTFLQALAKQLLASDSVTIVNSLNSIAMMTTTNMDIAEITSLAIAMRGMQETDIYTYIVPGDGGISPDDQLWYEITDDAAWQALMSAIDAGEYPEQDLEIEGETPPSYQATPTTGGASSGTAGSSVDHAGGSSSNVNTSDYLVAVRNGWGIQGAATSVSDMLAIAGYQQGEIGNTNAKVYKETLIVYATDDDKAAAEDIQARLGYGRIVASLGRYAFEGDILVVVGSDFPL
ncbi:MAG: LCP family protein [Coriobacteriales bacterium]|nr:LCP family protein [Coriobacteriales bacterium]